MCAITIRIVFDLPYLWLSEAASYASNRGNIQLNILAFCVLLIHELLVTEASSLLAVGPLGCSLSAACSLPSSADCL